MHPCYCVSIIPERPSSSFFIAGLYMTVSAWTVRRCEVNSVKQRRTWCCWRVARSRSELLSLRMAGSTHESIFRASLKLGPRGSIECSSDYAYQQKMSGRWSLPDAVSTKEEVRVQVVSGPEKSVFPRRSVSIAQQVRRGERLCRVKESHRDLRFNLPRRRVIFVRTNRQLAGSLHANGNLNICAAARTPS